MLLVMMILCGGVLGCGKDDPEKREGSPFERSVDKDKKERNPFMPKGVKPGGK
jgi:hypothetical protein